MLSNDLIKKVSSANQPLKVRGVITGSTGATAIVYYCKPSINSKLLLPKLTLLTNTCTTSATVTISKTTITDPDLLPDTVQLSTTPTITASDVTNSSLYQHTLPSNVLTTTLFQPVASNGITDALLTVNPDATTSNAIKITITDIGSGSEVMTGVLELEFLPI